MTRLSKYLLEDTDITNDDALLEHLYDMISPKFLDECKRAKKFLYRGSNRHIEDYDVSTREDRSRKSYMTKYMHNAFNEKFKDEFVKWRDEIKRKQCIKKGIDLLIIDDKDWYKDKTSCLNNVCAFIT